MIINVFIIIYIIVNEDIWLFAKKNIKTDYYIIA